MVVAAEPFVIFSHRFRLRQMQAALFALDDQRGGLWFSLVALVTQAVLFALVVAHEVPEKKAEREASDASSVSKAKNLYRKELEWMRKQPKARGTKSQSRIDAFYETEEKANKKLDDSKLELNIQMSRLGNKIIDFSVPR